MPDVHLKQFILETLSGSELRGDMRWKRGTGDERGGQLPVIIVCHGFKAYKDWGPFPAIGEHFAHAGFVSIVFNFTHNGIGKEPRKFSERQKFFSNTISFELEDVESLVEGITSGKIEDGRLDASRIGIVGHSRGGGVAIIKASEDRRIKAVAGWSTVARFARHTEAQAKRWREKGFLGPPSATHDDPFVVGTALLDDLELNAARLDIGRAVKWLHKPLLLVHGTADLPVPIEETNHLYDVADKTLTEYIVLQGAGHMYGARHPYTHEAPTLVHVLGITSAWFHKHL